VGWGNNQQLGMIDPRAGNGNLGGDAVQAHAEGAALAQRGELDWGKEREGGRQRREGGG